MATQVAPITRNSGDVTVNPLDHLADEQRTALAKRFNKSWLKPRQAQIDELENLYGTDHFTACFIVALIEDANTLISNERINKASDLMVSYGHEILNGTEANLTEALRQIQNVYESLNGTDAQSAGKKFLKNTKIEHTLKDARKIIDAVLAHLGLRESVWM